MSSAIPTPARIPRPTATPGRPSVRESFQLIEEWDFARHKSCPFCGKRFGRGDGARRHARTCPERGAGDLVLAGRRGRPQHACDECVRNKILCDAKSPCKRCASRSLVCTFRGPRTREEKAQRRRGLVRSDRPQVRSRVPFLLACTDPRSNFVNDVMVAGEPEHEEATSANWTSPAELDVSIDTIDPRILFMGYMDPDPGTTAGFDLTAVHHASSATSFSSKVELMRTGILQVAAAKPGLGLQMHHENFNDFFTLANFHKLVMAFFRRRQLLARIIHRATFDPAKAEPALLLAIALCGQAYTAHTTNSASYKRFITVLRYLADKLIFGRLRSCSAEGEPRHNLELCQAAYLITILQISSNDAEAREKAVTKRQSALMGALRRLQIIGCHRPNVEEDLDWKAFVYKESCNRLASFAFFNDGLLALFCNRQPTTTVSEMVNALPCCDELWEVDNLGAFVSKQMQPPLDASCVSMQLVLKDLLGDFWDDKVFEVCEFLTVFDLYATIGCFQLLLLHHRASFMLLSTKVVLLRAIERWERLWSEALARVTPEERQWLGVARHAPEFALASRIIIHVSTNGANADSEYLKCIPQQDLQAFHQFLLQHS